ncbi:hypothetical protein GCM10017557_12250 [Streptomyces aurantiacus]|uniref:Uncharacterized protein n=1 Tax=Streptomyces aurantiacus TaxID=47760 RepID=A0A7G1NXV1_9ACTN|nr:hypothetical protein GCM10017557_12250 [Streptomyces aurantiacus]
MTGGRSVSRFGFRRRGVRKLGLGRSEGRENFRQTAAVGGGVSLNAPGQALPLMKTVADLDGFWGAIGNALPIGKRAVAADDLHTRMSAQPSAELFGVPVHVCVRCHMPENRRPLSCAAPSARVSAPRCPPRW